MSTKQPSGPIDAANIFEAFGDLFGELFGMSPNLGVTLELTDEQAATGGRHEVEVARRVACGACEGRGTTRTDGAMTTCTACAGKQRSVQTQGFFQIVANCQSCHGRGHVLRDPCDGCGGAGTTTECATVAVDVPAGAQHEQTITIVGAGARRDGVVGDLDVYLLVGGRPDSRLAKFELPAELPRATVHRAPSASRRPPVALVIIVIALVVLVALTVVLR